MLSTTSTTRRIVPSTIDTTCPHGDDKCFVGFPCLGCTGDWEAANGITPAQVYGTSESTPTHRVRTHADGGVSTIAPATEKQIAFLTRLVAEKLPTIDDPAELIRVLVSKGKRAVSASIDELVKTPTPAVAGVPATFRWTKVDGEWLVRGDAGVADGSTITITKASGETADAVITGCAGDGLYRVRKVEATTTTTATTADVPAGHYAIDSKGDNDTLFVRVDVVTEGKWAGRTFVKMIVGGHPDAPIRGGQATDVLARIVEAGVAEAATRYGVEIGRCHVCNRTLTDETSRSLGIGPDCRGRQG